MKDDILTYREMCDLEDVQTLQRGMNFQLNPTHSVVLMSQRSNAPYSDMILEDGITIEYEGHDVPKSTEVVDPKRVDQALITKTGSLTQNGLFVKAIEEYCKKNRSAEKIRVYEKLFSGVWSYRGLFDLVDYYQVQSNERMVFRFRLQLTEDEATNTTDGLRRRTRIIPTQVKKEVWERDGGKCVICGATDELHFDHDIPFSRGGASITADNVRILCARHNLQKSDKIQ
ncbi:MAG TPA: HNH endonuclease [candidate division Zixibacteria bacterium]|nr:HNH endonuclease [candidate division Zixibacteria bacterium]